MVPAGRLTALYQALVLDRCKTDLTLLRGVPLPLLERRELHDDAERLYFVVETKGTLSADMLRDTEAAKVACGKVHFEAVSSGGDDVQYVVARTLEDVLTY
jgi:hypothetical protein